MKLSIIIPVYNMERYLPQCLDSVIAPEHAGEYEVIAVNDGSSDKSAEILESYRSRYPELVRVVTKPNGGLGSARNAGMEQAKGDYLVFLDSDDYLAENAVGEMLSAISKNASDIIFFDQAFYNEKGREVMRYPGAGRTGSFTFEEYPQILFCTPNAGNKIFRASLFSDNHISFPPRQWFEDVNSIYLLYPHTGTMSYVPKAWNCHLQRPGSITNSGNALRNREMITAEKDLYDYYQALDLLSPELEYCIFYNCLLCSVDRVNLIDPESPVQKELWEEFVSRYPHYRENPYIASMPLKHKLLLYLIRNGQYRWLHAVLTRNARKHA